MWVNPGGMAFQSGRADPLKILQILMRLHACVLAGQRDVGQIHDAGFWAALQSDKGTKGKYSACLSLRTGTVYRAL